MHRIKKWIFSAICFLAVVSGTAGSAAAVGLPAGFLIGDQDGISVSADGEYIINAVGLMPGDVLTKTITIRDLSEGLATTLTLYAEPLETSGPVDLLNAIHLTLELVDKSGQKTQLYNGRVRGDEDTNMIQNALQLGVYNTGDQAALNVRLVLDETIVPDEEVSVAEIKWIFNAVRAVPPMQVKTGGTAEYLLYGAGIGGVLLISILLITKRKKKENADRVHSLAMRCAFEQPISWKGV
ncbi:MAG: LPXTG cell wall anchor domain-containing protein [Oscillospiraceae bacterium]|jgi:LPXTG-motif cell wall-anchored protein|nr:LPXTG cell wall anchor domain-containing protein [Oscillospiraceae bacterium]